MMAGELRASYRRGDTIEAPCRWDDGLIVVRQRGLEPVDAAIAAAIADHQATVAHQAARRRYGIADQAPPPRVERRRPAAW